MVNQAQCMCQMLIHVITIYWRPILDMWGRRTQIHNKEISNKCRLGTGNIFHLEVLNNDWTGTVKHHESWRTSFVRMLFSFHIGHYCESCCTASTGGSPGPLSPSGLQKIVCIKKQNGSYTEPVSSVLETAYISMLHIQPMCPKN